MKFVKIIMMMACVGMLVSAAQAAQTNYAIGEVGASELKIPLGARPISMGEAFVGKADDVNALAWNPSGLAQIKGHQAGFMHSMYLQEISMEYLTYAQELFSGAGIGVNMMLLNFGSMDKIDEVNGLPEVVGEFTPTVLTGSVGYGQWLMDNLAVGGALKIYMQNIDSESYSAFAADIGALFKPGVDGLQLGLSIQNLGTPIAESANLPMNVKVGGAYVLPVKLGGENDVWNALLDVNLPLGDVNYTSVQIGTEYVYNNLAALRVGFKVKDTGELDGLSGLTAGAGFMYEMIKLDYAMVTFGDLGLTHQIMVGVNF
jgi:uncharacterized protein UPF0164